MRKLGHGQSVMFFAPAEIDKQIRRVSPLGSLPKPGTLNVLHWAMIQTCHDLQHNVSHWARQGVEHNRTSEAEKQYNETNDIAVLEKGWKAPESRTLEQLYGIPHPSSSSSPGFTTRVRSIQSLNDRLNFLGVQVLEDPSMNEEQEREVSQEVQLEREIQRPPKRKPATHSIHHTLTTFVRTGSVPRDLLGIIPLFRPLESFGSHILSSWSESLFATEDFCNTITKSSRAQIDDYMRPLNWILSSHNGGLVVISPYEANALIPEIRGSKIVRLHVFTPRITKSMKSFSDLRFYTLPALPTSNQLPPSPLVQIQLNLWAGQLYLQDYNEYRWLCAFLGICLDTGGHGGKEIPVQSDGFVMPSDRQVLVRTRPEYAICGFPSSPVNMLKELISHRRKGMAYLRTHLGQVLHARQLNPDDF